jgi:hypothetical protein
VHSCNPRFTTGTREWFVVHAHFVIAAGVCLLSSVGIIGALIRSQLQLSKVSSGKGGFRKQLSAAVAKSESGKLIVLSVFLTISLTINICKIIDGS